MLTNTLSYLFIVSLVKYILSTNIQYILDRNKQNNKIDTLLVIKTINVLKLCKWVPK